MKRVESRHRSYKRFVGHLMVCPTAQQTKQQQVCCMFLGMLTGQAQDAEGGSQTPTSMHSWSTEETIKYLGNCPIVKEEVEEPTAQLWESQWQEFLSTVEVSPSVLGVSRFPQEPTPWDDTPAFLASFEQVARAYQWPKEEWAARLLPTLKGEAELAFSSLEDEDREDYGKVKAAILRGDALNQEKNRQCFRRFCYEEAEGPRETYNQLQELCRRWLKAEKNSKEQILELLILEQFLTVLPPEIQSWIKKHNLESSTQAVSLAEDFVLKWRLVVKEEQMTESQAEESVNLSEVEGTSSDAGQRSPPSWECETEEDTDFSDTDWSDGGNVHENKEKSSQEGMPPEISNGSSPQFGMLMEQPQDAGGGSQPADAVHSWSTAVSSGSLGNHHAVKEEVEEPTAQLWETQWREFLSTVEVSPSVPEVPQFPQEPTPWDDTPAFLASFEQVARAYQWPEEEWAARLLPTLKGEAELAFSSLEDEDREDYRKVKAAILRGDALNQEKNRQCFRRFCYEEAKGPREAYNQLQELCRRWLKVERNSKEEILELLILEQFLTVLPPEIQSWVKKHNLESSMQAVSLAEDFVLKWRLVKEEQAFGSREISNNINKVAESQEEGSMNLSEVTETPSDAGQRPQVCRESETEEDTDFSDVDVSAKANFEFDNCLSFQQIAEKCVRMMRLFHKNTLDIS
ncbi:hypothetical protein JD844_013804 [Phrynosoma platyrhinos]|uniref:SCAN box domain-containing protein n=1 Tax=Phrynosoma platyrhinos TaxID=52577 RepID=A0ABQ7TLM8_PHRPL|nr:hypothetical protein JD844_013804 [Phrynosoma platyrhinos]